MYRNSAMNITPLRPGGDTKTAAAVEQSLAQARRQPQPLDSSRFSWAPSYRLGNLLHQQEMEDRGRRPSGARGGAEGSGGHGNRQASTMGGGRLMQRSGFAMQRSYDNLAQIAAGVGNTSNTTSNNNNDQHRRPSKSLPKPPGLEHFQRRPSNLAQSPITASPTINTSASGMQRKKSIKVDTPSSRRGARAGQITVETEFADTVHAPNIVTPTIERGTLRRKPSNMIRAARAPDAGENGGARTPAMAILSSKTKYNIWGIFAQIVTCCIPALCLRRVGHMAERAVQQAWREKLALCIIIVSMCAALGFLTYGFVATVCKTDNIIGIDDFTAYTPATVPHQLAINGIVYNMSTLQAIHDGLPQFQAQLEAAAEVKEATGMDVSAYFWHPATPPAECVGLFKFPYTPTCGTGVFPDSLDHCHDPATLPSIVASNPTIRVGPVIYEWPDVNVVDSTLMVLKDRVLDLKLYLQQPTKLFGDWTDQAIRTHLGTDASKAFSGSPARLQMSRCLVSLYGVGRIEEKTLGCIASDIILYVSLIMILSVVIIRFSLAITFDWFVAWQLGKLETQHAENTRAANRKMMLDQGIVPFPMKGRLDGGNSARNSARGSVDRSAMIAPAPMSKSGSQDPLARVAASEIQTPTKSSSITTLQHVSNLQVPSGTQSPTTTHNHPLTDEQRRISEIKSKMAAWSKGDEAVGDNTAAVTAEPNSMYSSPYGLEVYTLMMVAAYSEGAEGLRNTMESLASTIYSDDHKLIFIVADGLITGSGNEKSTPDIILDMLEMDQNWPLPPRPHGAKRHNMAQVYVAWYRHADRCVPTILIVKCGTPEEATQPKPGNRGKRDSQIILMSFLQKVTFDDPMTPLDYDLFQKMHYLMGVTPDVFEIVLMVDADTKVAPDSVARMVASMVSDPDIMGLCGETRIANKSETWVSRIQVFEYYLSHHLAKAFESVFGGVTCLPGCFCMYRIKAPKGDGFWVPILCNPDIVNTYSENHVDTLHKKNLLLLGEDRFLTTLMLGTFPHRKQIFVPRAYCKTVVPAEFKVLLSQRRRWINSTIHNLMELVLVRELCGVFCFSMQFVIMLELVGTVVLPAAICFTFLLIIMTFVGPEVPYIPLSLLGAILGLPAILILLTTRRRIYIYWMCIYLLALPIWNFVLPVYAFWHFDDFSWGQTRKVAGEAVDKTGHGGAGQGEVDGGNEVPRRKWVDWETERRKAMVLEFENERQMEMEQERLDMKNREEADTPAAVDAEMEEIKAPPPPEKHS
ncbi:chitin synthase-domain-containing protein [Powellomyces hirtus]|nr:chitin synthase-domain-containing protein [Powellomyces hirtus]